ncbi:hypothetical protein BV924_14820 [Pectobacterium odoriferum]|uniref:Lipopolysaccharide core biosynthesis protein RfaS n=2 Tax=Pectobacterium odoriferum TaxID=78398 RepID=A0ABD6VPJ7_9GAMM|nr:hypothetical protein BVY06_13410 [Pectobacterium odoriferum]POE11487.1 hypothetical protein BV924_14820 [Pectobacterium odoriferum]POE25637.1 hypothetical protein BV926_14825 [Pectobacterium odoriferum]POE38899.1 hypothetical protein BV920_14825 [Pectobacterium odoriferum]
MRIFFSDWLTDYESIMINAINDKFKVSSIILTKGIKYKLIVFFASNKISRFFVRNYLNKKFKKDDIIFFNESRYHKYVEIIKIIDCKKVLLLKNIVSYNKKFNINEAKNTFNKIYSFDEEDCRKYNLELLNQMFPFTIERASLFLESNHIKEIYDVYYLGKEKNRRKEINETYDILKKSDLNLKFLIFTENKKENNRYNFIQKPIPYIENLINVINSKAVLEVNIEGQSGLTLRALEAIFFNKKLITNNISIMNYDFYSPNRVFILGVNNLSHINEFLEKKIERVNQNILMNYSPDFILKKIITS